MIQDGSTPRPPLLYRACFLVGCGLLAACGVGGLVLAFSDREPLRGLGRLDPQAGAEALQASGDLAAAARELRMLTLIDPSDCPSFEAWADVLARQGDLEGSLRVRLRHVAVHPYSAAAHTSLGTAFERLSRSAEAYGAFSMAVRLNPGEGAALAAMGDIARKHGRLDEAIALYQRALPHTRETARVYNKLAIAHALAGRREQAVRHFDEALRLDPGFAEAQENRALLAAAARPFPAATR